MTKRIAVEDIAGLFDYDPLTGYLRWKVSRTNTIKVGAIAGCISPSTGYRVISLRGIRTSAHRVAWALTYGKWPDNAIDHINGIRSDNRIDNLRDIKQIENCQNKAKNCNNTTGTTGVSFIRETGKYRAYIMNGRKNKHLGVFFTYEEARAARLNAEPIYHPFREGSR